MSEGIYCQGCRSEIEGVCACLSCYDVLRSKRDRLKADLDKVRNEHIDTSMTQLHHDLARYRAMCAKMAEALLTPDQLRATANWIIKHGDLTTAQLLTAEIIKQKARLSEEVLASYEAMRKEEGHEAD